MPKPKIKYGVYDGFPVRLADTGEIWVLFGDTWCVPSRPVQVFCYDAGLLSEQEFHRSFPDVPPLPPHAFSGDRWARTDRPG